MTDTAAGEMNFEQWIAALDAEAVKRGVEGEPYSEQTGVDAWRDFYDDGYSPVEALDEEFSCA